MPLLEQRRESPPAAPDGRGRSGLRLSRAAVRSWPLAWAAIHLAFFLLGARFGARQPWPADPLHPATSPSLVRLAGVLPALLLVPGAALPVGLGTAAFSFGAGWSESATRNARTAALASARWEPATAVTWEGPLMLRITGWPSAAAHGSWRVPARLVRAGSGQGHLQPMRGDGVLLTGRGDPPAIGNLIAGRVRLRVPDRSRIPGGFDDRRFLAGRGLDHRGRIEEWQHLETGLAGALERSALADGRRGLLGRLRVLLPPREAGLAAAVLLGVRGPDHRVTGASFTALGLAHLFAVSGLHVGILLGLLTLPARAAGLGPRDRFLPLLILLPVYALLTGMPGSVVRAVGLALLALAAPVVGARPDPLRFLGLLFWMGCVWEPRQVLDTGLQLSYLAAGGILAVSALTDGFRFCRHPVLRWPLAGIGVSVAAQWFTLPVVAASFGRLSLMSPLANLVAVPVFGAGVWLTTGALVLSPLGSGFAGLPASWAWLVFRGLAGLVEVLDRGGWGIPLGLAVPGPAFVLMWLALTLAGLVMLRWRRSPARSRRAVGGVILVVATGLTLAGPMTRSLAGRDVTLWSFDVGQGDCTLVRLPDGWTVLVDLGGVLGRPGPGAATLFGRTVAPWLTRQGVRHIDAVVLTHGHLDHTAGARDLLADYRVDAWYCGGRSHRAVDDSTAVVIRPRPGRHLLHRQGPWTLRLLVPAPPAGTHPNENDFSLVTVLAHGEQTVAVLSGDLEEGGERRLLANGLVPRLTEVWKAGHHGSATSGSPEFLSALDPALVLVSCGVANRYGHPSHGVYVAEGDTLPILRTDLDGSLRLRWSRGGKFLGFDTALGRVP